MTQQDDKGDVGFVHLFPLPKPADKSFLHKTQMMIQVYKKKSGNADRLLGNEIVRFICLVGKTMHQGIIELDYKFRGLPIILHVAFLSHSIVWLVGACFNLEALSNSGESHGRFDHTIQTTASDVL